MEPIVITGIALILLFMNGKKNDTDSVVHQSFIWPVKGTIRITSPFGATRANGKHNGIDIAVPVGTPVLAIADGVVDSIWNDNTYGGGLSLRVKHANGFTIGYAHLSKNNLLSTGAKVSRGDTVALSGNTGNSTGPHLHMTVRKDGVLINPINVLPQ